jgi:hypothetical protein
MRDTTSHSGYSSARKSILKGKRDFNTGLWRINLRHEIPQHTIYVANNVYELRNTAALVNLLHKAMFIPTKSALLQAVKNGHLITWSGLTEQVINKHLKMTPACSTSKFSITSDIEDETFTPVGLGSKNQLV